jgi:hypothetical protein
VQPEPDDGETPSGQRSVLPWLLLFLLLAILVLRYYFTLPEQRAKRKKTDRERWMVWVHELFAVLHVMHFDRLPSETPSSFLERIASQSLPEDAVSQLSDCASAVFYGHELPLPSDIDYYRTTVLSLTRRLTWWQKLRLVVLRMIPRRRYL